MKKALIVLLILAVAGGLFAQINFSGNVASGLLVAFDEDGHYFYTSKSQSDNVDPYSYGFYAEAALPSGKAGGNIGFSGANGDPWGLDGANVWFKPLDILSLSSSGYGTGFGTPGPVDTNNGVNDSRGLNLVLDAIPGLSVGATVAPNDGLEFGDAAYGLGVKFDMTGLLGVVANLKYDGAEEKTNAAFGVSVDALSNIAGLKIAADIGAENITKLEEGALTAGLSVGFGVAGLDATLKGKLGIPTADGPDMNILIGADLGYGIGAATIGLGVGYLVNGAVDYAGKFNPGMWEGMDVAPVAKMDESILKINPSVSFSVGEAALRIGYALATNVGGASKMNHEIFTGFSIDF